MEQSVVLNALAPYLALAKSATSPRAAADLITQATSAANTYVFAELLQQKNVQALQDHEQYGSHFELLKIFAWGTWEQYKAQANLPSLNDAQTLKIRLLSLLTIAAEPHSTTSTNLTYTTLCTRLDLASPIDLEHLITQAIYSNLITGTLNPAAQTVVITSVSPLRDLAPGSASSMMAELAAWSSRCDTVLGELEAEIARVKADAVRRTAAEKRTEKQVKSEMEASEKNGGGRMRGSKGAGRGSQLIDDDGDEDGMDLDLSMPSGMGRGGGKKKGGGGGGGAFGGLMGKFSGKSGGR